MIIYDVIANQQKYQTLSDIIQDLKALETIFINHRDRRAVFVTLYLKMTQELQKSIAVNPQIFQDVEWVKSAALVFANGYRTALSNYGRLKRDIVPKAWVLAFDMATEDKSIVILDMILGINAHVNYDLALALLELRDTLKTYDDRKKRKSDFDKLNDILNDATDPIQDVISHKYSPLLRMFDFFTGSLDEEMTRFSFETAREHSWVNGLALINASSEEEREMQRKKIDEQSHAMGRFVLLTLQQFPLLMDAVRLAERRHKWVNVIESLKD